MPEAVTDAILRPNRSSFHRDLRSTEILPSYLPSAKRPLDDYEHFPPLKLPAIIPTTHIGYK
jgi:hypothetical protein